MGIIKSQKEIEKMDISGSIASRILKQVAENAIAGTTTQELNDIAVKLIQQNKVQAGFLNYDGFPAVVCTSVNATIVHGLPGEYVLKDGDIIGLDFGVIYEGWYSDTAVTVGVGEVSHEARRIMQVCKKALRLGIKKARPGSTTGDIGNTVQRFVESEGYSVVRELVGHGVGTRLHEEPQVPNYGARKSGTVLEQGMVIAIEPMIIDGPPSIKLDKDGFGYVSTGKHLTAHFEHTVAILKNGAKILTEE